MPSNYSNTKISFILSKFGHNYFNNKVILDVGSAEADIPLSFYRLGAKVTCFNDNISTLKKSAKHTQIKYVYLNISNEINRLNEYNSNLILHFNTLHKVENPEEHLRELCSFSKSIILESPVYDHKDIDAKVSFEVNDIHYKKTTLITSDKIEEILREFNFSFSRYDDLKLNYGNNFYNWHPLYNEEINLNKRRFWIAKKEKKSNLSKIIEYKRNPDTIGNKKLKVALCISGHLRVLDKTFYSIYKNIINLYDTDIFVHTWDSLGNPHRPLDKCLMPLSSEQISEFINVKIKPKKFIIEPPKSFEISDIMKAKLEPGRDIVGILSMFYKIKECNNLKKEYEKENNLTYDAVIRCRGDLQFKSPVIISNLKNDIVYLPEYGNFAGANDQFAFGTSSTMDKYCSLFDNINIHLKNCHLNPEKILAYHLKANSLNILKSKINYVIIRSNGLIQDNYLLEKAMRFIR